MKDNFSTQSDQYAKYRPAYPQEFFDYLPTIIAGKINAWDCGTGNGQVAQKLAGLFEKVFATDISQSQLDNAVKKTNIYYSLQPAENTNFLIIFLISSLLHRPFTGLILTGFIQK